MIEKNFKTLDEQIEIYKKKGLIINDVKFTKQILLRENYFFLNGYRHPFYNSKDNKTFIKGTTFEELYRNNNLEIKKYHLKYLFEKI